MGNSGRSGTLKYILSVSFPMSLTQLPLDQGFLVLGLAGHVMRLNVSQPMPVRCFLLTLVASIFSKQLQVYLLCQYQLLSMAFQSKPLGHPTWSFSKLDEKASSFDILSFKQIKFWHQDQQVCVGVVQFKKDENPVTHPHTHNPQIKASNLYINLMPKQKQFITRLLILTSVGWALGTTHSRSYSSEDMGSNLVRNNTTYPK